VLPTASVPSLHRSKQSTLLRVKASRPRRSLRREVCWRHRARRPSRVGGRRVIEDRGEHRIDDHHLCVKAFDLVRSASAPTYYPTHQPTYFLDRNYFNLGADVTATLKRGASAFFYYETVLGRDNVTNRSFNAGVRFQFE